MPKSKFIKVNYIIIGMLHIPMLLGLISLCLVKLPAISEHNYGWFEPLLFIGTLLFLIFSIAFAGILILTGSLISLILHIVLITVSATLMKTAPQKDY